MDIVGINTSVTHIAKSARKRRKLKKGLASVLNRLSIDAELEIPDFILADYLYDCLNNLRDLNNQIKKHNNV